MTRNDAAWPIVQVHVDVPGWSPRERAVVSALRQLADAATPDEATRERIRTGIAERLAAEETPIRRRHPVLTGTIAAGFTLLLALVGLGLLLSKDALPGDPLYGVKRAGESAELGLTFNDRDRALKHLEFAATRLDELAALRDAEDSAYLTALTDFETDARAGVAQLGVLSIEQGGGQLGELRSWAQRQAAKLTATLIPAAVADHYARSAALLNRIEVRALALSDRLSCYEITSGEADDLGALPADGACQAPAASGEPPRGIPATPNQIPPAREVTTVTSTSPQPVNLAPTAPVAPSSGGAAHPAVEPPIVAATSPRLPETTTPPPLISIPPLIPGLPGIGIG